MLTIPEEIKELFHQDHCYKNIRIHFPNKERADICNDLIVKDSVSFKESLCSQNTLKFGLCEASVFECETVGVGNIKGAKIEVYCEIECPSTVSGAEWKVDLQKYVYPVPYGIFVVDSCQRQADMIHRKIVAYGGTNILSVKNSILRGKESAPTTSAINYQPDIFATMMMCSEGSALIPDVTLTQVDESGSVILAGSPAAAAGNVIYNARVITIDTTNEDELYYLQVPDYINPKYTYRGYRPDFGIFVFRPPLADRPYIYQYYSTEGAYIYPYQIFNKVETYNNYRSYILIYIAYRTMHWESQQGVITPVYDDPFRDVNECKIYKVDRSNYPTYRLNIPREEGITYQMQGLRPIADAGYLFDPSSIDYYQAFQDYSELLGEFFTLDRNGAPRLVNIKQQFGLLPDDDLYPDTNLYPEGVTGGKLIPQDYQSCWYDDDYTLLYGKISLKYKDTNNVDQVYERYINGINASDDPNTYLTYDLTNNKIFSYWTWTANDIANACAIIANNLEGVRYLPVDFVGRGLPYVEAGDTFEILTRSNDSITTIVLDKTTSGEQTLTDSYKSV